MEIHNITIDMDEYFSQDSFQIYIGDDTYSGKKIGGEFNGQISEFTFKTQEFIYTGYVVKDNTVEQFNGFLKNLSDKKDCIPHVIVPSCYRLVNTDYYIFLLPMNNTMYKLVDVIDSDNIKFPLIPSRIMTCMNLLEAFYEITRYIKKDKELPLLDVNSIYVDVQTGKLLILYKDIFEKISMQEPYKNFMEIYPFYFSPEWYAEPTRNPFDENGVKYFLAVMLFRILFKDDPFDGAKTLETYPFLSPNAISNIYGKPEFIFSSRNNGNRYIGNYAHEMWENKKSILKEANQLKDMFISTFTGWTTGNATRYDIEDWLKTFRNLKDQLSAVEGKWILLHSDTGINCREDEIFLKLGNSVIPLTVNRILYRYHILQNQVFYEKGIDAPVAKMDKSGYLVNLDHSYIWHISDKYGERPCKKFEPILEQDLLIYDKNKELIIKGTVVTEPWKESNE